MCDTEAAGTVSFFFQQFEISRLARTMNEQQAKRGSLLHLLFLSVKKSKTRLTLRRFFIGQNVSFQARSLEAGDVQCNFTRWHLTWDF
jgi:hypothetical protein